MPRRGCSPCSVISAARGRFFTAAEEEPAAPAVAVISDRLWQRRFGGDPAIVGTAVTHRAEPGDDRRRAAAGSTFQDIDVWTPLRAKLLSPMQRDRANHPGFQVIARLRDGVGIEQAQREMSGIAAALERQYPASNHQMGVSLTLAARRGRRRDPADAAGAARGGRRCCC